MQVSLDGEFAHVETCIAAHPTDPNTLVGAAVTTGAPGPGRRTVTKIYATKDGGVTWTPTTLKTRSGPDPEVVFGADGAAYFSTIGVPLHRSTDGGVTWAEPTKLGKEEFGDHPMMVADLTQSKHRGTLYVSTFGYYLQTIRPKEGVLSLSAPVKFPRKSYLLSQNPVVLADGTVFIPFTGFKKDANGLSTIHVSKFCLSLDGGKSVTEIRPIRIHENIRFRAKKSYRGAFVDYSSRTKFAVGHGPFKDRIYMVWAEHFGRHDEWLDSPTECSPPRVWMCYSDDRGDNWGPPIEIDGDVPVHTAQYLPMVSVNRQGVVAVAWLDTRDDPTTLSYNVYATVSTDGGRSFLPATRLSTESSYPHRGQGNRRFYLNVQSHEKSGVRNLHFDSGFRRWGMGGDYVGMAAAADGSFHPLWPDARSGTYQLYSCRFSASLSGEPDPPSDLVSLDVTSQVKVRLDHSQFDVETSTATLAMRVLNTSEDRIYGPVHIEIARSKNFEVLNADSHKEGKPCFHYDNLFGTYSYLRGRGTSEAKSWKFRYPSISGVPELDLRIFARVKRETVGRWTNADSKAKRKN